MKRLMAMVCNMLSHSILPPPLSLSPCPLSLTHAVPSLSTSLTLSQTHTHTLSLSLLLQHTLPTSYEPTRKSSPLTHFNLTYLELSLSLFHKYHNLSLSFIHTYLNLYLLWFPFHLLNLIHFFFLQNVIFALFPLKSQTYSKSNYNNCSTYLEVR